MADDSKNQPEIFADISVGALLGGRYELEHEIGFGGSSIVFTARDQVLDEEVAVKLFYPSPGLDPETGLKRFRAEARLARRLSHPNIVRVHDIGTVGSDRLFISMEYVRGTTLEDWLIAQPPNHVSVSSALPLMVQTASALAYAHKQDVVHRDVKPANIFVQTDGPLKLGDFGTANCITFPEGITKTGYGVGTPTYMSPEQFGDGDVDQGADIYSFGIMTFRMCVGRVPFDSISLPALMGMHFSADVPHMPDLVEDIPNWLQDFVEICLEKKRKNRFSTMNEALSFLIEKAKDHPGVDVSRLFPLCPVCALGQEAEPDKNQRSGVFRRLRLGK